jgi:hypothetical protein
VVAGRYRDHPGATRSGIERQELVESAAFLERAGALHAFELQGDFGPGAFRQSRRFDRRGARHGSFDFRGGAADLGNRDRQLGHHSDPTRPGVRAPHSTPASPIGQ